MSILSNFTWNKIHRMNPRNVAETSFSHDPSNRVRASFDSIKPREAWLFRVFWAITKTYSMILNILNKIKHKKTDTKSKVKFYTFILPISVILSILIPSACIFTGTKIKEKLGLSNNLLAINFTEFFKILI